MAGRLGGKRAVITAAGQGMGRATALAFPEEGAEVFAPDIDGAAGHAPAPGRARRKGWAPRPRLARSGSMPWLINNLRRITRALQSRK